VSEAHRQEIEHLQRQLDEWRGHARKWEALAKEHRRTAEHYRDRYDDLVAAIATHLTPDDLRGHLHDREH